MNKFWQSLSVQCSKRILLAILLSSLLVAAISYIWVRDNAINEQRRNLNTLLETMQSSTRVACFANNAILAQEVVDGLRLNKLIIGSVIWSDGKVLAHSGTDFFNQITSQKFPNVLIQAVSSPFDEKEIIGQIAIQFNQEFINQETQRNILFIGMLLASQAILLIIVVNIVVFDLIVRPVEQVASQLEHLQSFDDNIINCPKKHQYDELGLLVEEINQLNSRLNLAYTEEVNLRIQLEQDENRFRSIFEYAQTGLFVIDNVGNILSYNNSFSEYLTLNDAQNNLFQTQLGNNAKKLNNILKNPEASSDYFELTNHNGEPYWLELSLKRINENSLQGILNDVTQLKSEELQQRNIALTDSLTGISNRRGFDGHIHSLFNNENKHSFILMLIDLDWFKQVNDIYGHAAGDLVLRHVAHILKASARACDYVSRLGGDEFAIIIENCSHTEFAIGIAKTIIEQIALPISIDKDHQVHIGASIGMALCKTDCLALEQLFDYADKALYQAKEAGRNGFKCYGCSDV
ncbi:putative signaling protein [Patescibacteria group bacterium]|nr:putative signaling protein [Patescibacteria group bacterium]